MTHDLARSMAFELPKGLSDKTGELQCHGFMRLATGFDEIYLNRSKSAIEDQNYGELIRLSRVITCLGTFQIPLQVAHLEELFLPDLVYLKDVYQLLHQDIFSGNASESIRYPIDQLYEEVAVIAFYFHWSQQDILNLDHAERCRWVREIQKLVDLG